MLVAQQHQTGVSEIHHPATIARCLGLHPGQFLRELVAADDQSALNLLVEIQHSCWPQSITQKKSDFGYATFAG